MSCESIWNLHFLFQKFIILNFLVQGFINWVTLDPKISSLEAQNIKTKFLTI